MHGEFQKAPAGPGKKDCRVVRLEQIQRQAMLDECGRATIWGDQHKVDLKAGARGSLDDRLEHDDDLKDLVKGSLMRLRASLDQG